jgi:hypothetical protein
MPEWLTSAGEMPDLAWQALLGRLCLAGLFGLLVAVIYGLVQRRAARELVPWVTTLVLLTMLVAMTTIVIGNSTARAFGLVGVLSIVRFRTVVEDTRDTSFVIFAVVVGMACGAGNVLICLLGVPLVGAAAWGMSLVGWAIPSGVQKRLEVRIGAARDPDVLLADVFRGQLLHWKLLTVVSARQGASLDLVYRVRLRDRGEMLALVKAIHALEGVQNVELKEE